jgi:hypothetical protein
MGNFCPRRRGDAKLAAFRGLNTGRRSRLLRLRQYYLRCRTFLYYRLLFYKKD